MANYATLKSYIDQYITTNGQGDITGAILNDVLKSIVNSIGADYLFGGIVVPSSNVGTPDQNVFFIATQGGSYQYFDEVVIPNGITIFKWSGSWSYQILFAGDGGIFDISAYHNNTKYADLTAALGTNAANVPDYVRKGGISVKFVQSSDNKYVQYRLMSDTFNTTVANWQGVDDEPTAESNNLVKSGGVYEEFNQLGKIVSINLQAANSIPYPIKGGVDYILTNKTQLFPVVSVRDTPDGESRDLITLQPNATTIWTPTEDGKYIRVGQACDIDIQVKDSPIHTLDEGIKNANEDIENIKSVDINNFLLEQGGINTLGLLVDIATRVRTVDYIRGTYNFTAPFGFRIYGVFYYNEQSLAFVERVPIGNRTALIHKDNCIAKVVICADDDTASITVDDVKNNLSLEYIKNKTKNVENNTLQVLNGILFEQGGINAEGVLVSHSKRVRTKDYLNGKIIISTPQGFQIHSIYYYNSSTLSFSERVLVFKTSYEVYKSGCVSKVVFCANDDTAPISISDIKSSLNLEYLDNKVQFNSLSNIPIEMGAIDYLYGTLLEKDTRLRTIDYINGEIEITAPDGYIIYMEYDYQNNGKFISSKGIYAKSAKVGGSAYKCKLTFSKTDETQKVNINEFRAHTTSAIDKAVRIALHLPTIVKLESDLVLKDVSSIVSGFDFTFLPSTGSIPNMMEQLYTQFDALVAAYPDYITKVDALTFVANEMSERGFSEYPLYARLNNVASGGYKATPNYNTYLYKLLDSTSQLADAPLCKKKTLLLVGCTHGIEVMSGVSSYILAKELCNGNDNNLFKLKESYDIYIIPCLNGYGIYNQTRYNANGIDLNRNYGVNNWEKVGNPGDQSYSGETPDSEFETCLVECVFNKIKPDVAIDHHSYWGDAGNQFYSEAFTPEINVLCYRSLVDCSFAFLKALPAYFGNKARVFVETSYDASPKDYIRDWSTFGKTALWFTQNGAKAALTLEVNAGISYLNGVFVPEHSNTYYSDDACSVAEYTLRDQLMKYCQYALEQ